MNRKQVSGQPALPSRTRPNWPAHAKVNLHQTTKPPNFSLAYALFPLHFDGRSTTTAWTRRSIGYFRSCLSNRSAYNPEAPAGQSRRWVLKSEIPSRKMIQPLFTENWSCWIPIQDFSLSKPLSSRKVETGLQGRFDPVRKQFVPRHNYLTQEMVVQCLEWVRALRGSFSGRLRGGPVSSSQSGEMQCDHKPIVKRMRT